MRQTLLAWTVETDPAGTRSIYRLIESGAARRCGCGPCRNFDAARPEHFPAGLLQLLSAAAVEPKKEVAVRLVSPLEGDAHLYAGTYAFCGHILSGRPYRGFPFLREEVDVFEHVGNDAHVALRPWPAPEGEWRGSSCVRLEFLVVLPWVLGDRGTRAVNLSRDLARTAS